jgi:hypothetical protein
MDTRGSAVARIRGKLHLDELFRLNDFIWNVENESIEIDFKEYQHSSIFDLVFLAHQFSNIQLRKRIKIIAKNHEHMAYAKGMNFFLVSGADWAVEVNPSEGDGFSYIPIQKIDCDVRELGLDQVTMNEEIDRRARNLAKVLLHVGSGRALDTIQYTLREIIRNIFEHSGASYFLIAGQYYPKHKNVQIVICDNGQGVQNSLRFNKPFSKLNDREALNIALMPGVSGNARALSSPRASEWQNSGYGLYMMSRLARHQGIMTIISGSHAIHLDRQNDQVRTKQDFEVSNFRGTLIRIGISLDDEDISGKLKIWGDEGKLIAANIAGAKQITASTASLLLRRDFN